MSRRHHLLGASLLWASVLILSLAPLGRADERRGFGFSAIDLEAPAFARSLAVGDLDGNGHLDLVSTGSAGLSVFFGAGDLVYQRVEVGPAGVAVVVADANDDGHLDLIQIFDLSGDGEILLGDGTGAFVQGPAFSFGFDSGGFRRLSLFEVSALDDDGFPELIAVYESPDDEHTVFVLENQNGVMGTLLTAPLVRQSNSLAIQAADLNVDGHLDLVMEDQDSASLFVVLADGAGFFDPGFRVAVNQVPTRLLAADVNEDGFPDLLSHRGFTSVLLGDGTGSFALSTVRDSEFPGAVVDVDTDGAKDLLAFEFAGGGFGGLSFNIHPGDGRGGFLEAIVPGPSYDISIQVLVADFDDDGRPDLLGKRSGGGLVLILNRTLPLSDRALRGTVNEGVGCAVDVLAVNGSVGDPLTRIVDVTLGEPLTVTLWRAPLGPDDARYCAWVWRGFPSNATPLRFGSSSFGITVNPTPLDGSSSPLPVASLLGGLTPLLVEGTMVLSPAPARAPWSLSRPRGFLRERDLVIQALIEDEGSSDPLGLSVTNAIAVRVR